MPEYLITHLFHTTYSTHFFDLTVDIFLFNEFLKSSVFFRYYLDRIKIASDDGGAEQL